MSRCSSSRCLTLRIAVVLAGAIFCSGAGAQTVFEQIGYDDLVERLGEQNVPAGFSITVGQVEAEASNGYGPNQNNPEFSGKTFNPQSGPPGSSGHANSVAENYYGNDTSIASGVSEIWLWEAGNWAQSGFLNAIGGSVPSTPGDIRIFNNSWIGSFGQSGIDNEILRRADYAVSNDEVSIINGVNNSVGGDNLSLMSHMFNGIAVGRADGDHVFAPTQAGIDVPGRMKPEIVAPAAFTSFAAPIVSAAAALLYETTETDATLSNNPNADKSEVIKAVLLAGATHRTGWTNSPIETGPDRGITETPLDVVFGVDLVNINRSHLILTGDEQDGEADADTAPLITETGWDFTSLDETESRFWTFQIDELGEEISILVTWHRFVSSTFSTSILPDFNLTLWRVDENGDLVTLVGDSGIDFFTDGNVVSQSAVDNLEHLYVLNLEPGTYAIELARDDENLPTPLDAAIAWKLPETVTELFGDINDDGVVDGSDLGLLLGAWGSDNDAVDLNDDGVVDGSDLGLLLGAWG